MPTGADCWEQHACFCVESCLESSEVWQTCTNGFNSCQKFKLMACLAAGSEHVLSQLLGSHSNFSRVNKADCSRRETRVLVCWARISCLGECDPHDPGRPKQKGLLSLARGSRPQKQLCRDESRRERISPAELNHFWTHQIRSVLIRESPSHINPYQFGKRDRNFSSQTQACQPSKSQERIQIAA